MSHHTSYFGFEDSDWPPQRSASYSSSVSWTNDSDGTSLLSQFPSPPTPTRPTSPTSPTTSITRSLWDNGLVKATPNTDSLVVQPPVTVYVTAINVFEWATNLTGDPGPLADHSPRDRSYSSSGIRRSTSAKTRPAT